MVKTPRTRHSKSRREPLTIELDPADVSRVPEVSGTAMPSVTPERKAWTTSWPAPRKRPWRKRKRRMPMADEAQASVPESDFATETGTAAQPEQEYQPAEALQEPAGSRLDEAEHAGRAGRAASAGAFGCASGAAAPRWILARGRRPHRRGCRAGRGRRPAICGPARRSRREFGRRTRRRRNREPASGDRGGQGAAPARSDLGARIDGVATGLDAVKAEVASLRETASSGAGGGDGAGLQALDARIKEIEAGIASLGRNGAPDGAALTALGERLAAIETLTKTEGDAVAQVDKRIAGLEQSVAALTGRVDAQAQQPKIALAIATAALKAAVDRGAPFTAELEAFAAIAPDAPGIATLRTFAEQGVPTREILLAEVEPAAAAMIAASRPVDPNAGFFDRLLQSAESLVTVRPIGAVEGSGVPEIVARMQVAMTAGDLDKAIAEFDTLPDAAKAAAGTFAEKLKARRDAEAAGRSGDRRRDEGLRKAADDPYLVLPARSLPSRPRLRLARGQAGRHGGHPRGLSIQGQPDGRRGGRRCRRRGGDDRLVAGKIGLEQPLFGQPVFSRPAARPGLPGAIDRHDRGRRRRRRLGAQEKQGGGQADPLGPGAADPSSRRAGRAARRRS